MMNLETFLSYLTPIAVALIGGMFTLETRRRKRQDAKTERRAAMRAEESRLSMKQMSANTALTIATAQAVKDGKANGSMADAMEKCHAAQREYYDFIDSVAASQITKI